MRLVPVAVALFVFGAQPAAGQAVSDSARLQGAWRMVSGSADGNVMPATAAASMRRVLKGNHLAVTMGGQVYFEATIQLNEAASPREIDYHMTAGFTNGAVQRGIYRMLGDTVFFSFAVPNAPRPTDFTTKAGDGRTLSAWVPARE